MQHGSKGQCSAVAISMATDVIAMGCASVAIYAVSSTSESREAEEFGAAKVPCAALDLQHGPLGKPRALPPRAIGKVALAMKTNALTPELLDRMDAYWRAANYNYLSDEG